MESTITSGVVIAYSQCTRKAYLLMFLPEQGEPHEYESILEEKIHINRIACLKKLSHENLGVCGYDAESMSNSNTVMVEAMLNVPGLQAYCDVLTPVHMGSSCGAPTYVPTLFAGTHTITEDQKLALGFAGYVLEQIQHTSLKIGTIMNVGGQKQTIKLDTMYRKLRTILPTLYEWVDTRPAEPPLIVLNKHCPYCPFRNACHEQAEHGDNLSLLDRMTPKMIQRYHRKGIFTVHQLSYLFKPRRRRKGSRNQPVRFNLELQALAIRTGKIYVHELPVLNRHPVSLYLDFEGIPDQRFHYLIGLLICEGEHQTHHALWAATVNDEERIWNELLKHIQRYPEAPIYHYGSYEPRAIKQLGRRYETSIDDLMTRLVNVNAYIYGKLYFPVRSNKLKDLGTFVGASWTAPEASGLQSLVWRYRWEDTRDDSYKDTLLTYNAEDCRALLALTSYLTTLLESADTQTDVDFADRPKQHATERGEDIHRVFDLILKSAHLSYANNRVRLRSATDQGKNKPKKRGGVKGHQAYQRVLPKRAGKVIRVAPRRMCPKHKGEPLQIGEQMAEHPIIDLHFTQNGCRKTVTKYVGKKGYCRRCDKYHNPRGIDQLGGQLFGHAFQAWSIYQRMILRLPYRVIVQVMEDMFGERTGEGTIINFFTRFARYYEKTERLLTQRILQSPFIHVDETSLNIQGTGFYVWVFTNGTHVILKLTATREATIVHEMLEHYDGVLVSDFYPGYDAVSCRQQKCLVHLVRELNNDLWSNPFNTEFEAFIFKVKNLLVPIFEAVEKYGLKRRHLHKFNTSVERFYQQHILDSTYTFDATIKYQKRFQRYRDSLFTFLDEDGIPWHNNTAERAIRQLAVQRKISGYFFERVAHQYLSLLGIAQTCRFQNKSFLKFLLSKEHDIDAFRSPKRVQISRPVSPTRVVDTPCKERGRS
jgi:predicted RecB family nuclease